MNVRNLTDEALIDELADIEEGLNEWELGFVDSITRGPGCFLTAKQRDKAEEIWERLCQ